MKKIVIIKHFGDNGHYLFSVPDGINLIESETVLVKTKRGERDGVCVCDSFYVDDSPLRALMAKYGAKEPLAPVIGRFVCTRFDKEEDHEND